VFGIHPTAAGKKKRVYEEKKMVSGSITFNNCVTDRLSTISKQRGAKQLGGLVQPWKREGLTDIKRGKSGGGMTLQSIRRKKTQGL